MEVCSQVSRLRCSSTGPCSSCSRSRIWRLSAVLRISVAHIHKEFPCKEDKLKKKKYTRKSQVNIRITVSGGCGREGRTRTLYKYQVLQMLIVFRITCTTQAQTFRFKNIPFARSHWLKQVTWYVTTIQTPLPVCVSDQLQVEYHLIDLRR